LLSWRRAQARSPLLLACPLNRSGNPLDRDCGDSGGPVAADERAGVLSLLFTVSYLGLGIPVVAIGILAVHGPGLIGAAEYHGAAPIVLAVLALLALAVLALVRAEQKERKRS
jgi:hypothetical protein